MNERPQRRTQVVWATVLLALLIGATLYFAPQIGLYLHLRRNFSQPWWNITPQTLVNSAAEAKPAKQLSYFGYRMDVPWAAIDKSWDDEKTAHVQFVSGARLIVTNPQKSESVFSQAAVMDPSDFQSRPSSKIAKGSGYQQLEQVLSMTPAQLNPFRSHDQFNYDYLRLVAKGILLEHVGAVDIYAIQNDTFKGFEVDGIDFNGKVIIILFDLADHQLRIDLSTLPDAKKLTQAEINSVIQSIAPSVSAVSVR